MKMNFKGLLLVVIAAIVTVGVMTISSCYKNPVTGRTSLSLVDDATIMSMSATQYATFLSTNPPIVGTPQADMVGRVGFRLQNAVNQYLASINQQQLVSNYQWEFNLVNNPEANAWCLPGGKVVVYTGILSLAANDTDLAVVLGHEIAHAVAKHGNERMSSQLASNFGGVALSVLLSSQPTQTQQLFNTVYGVGSNLTVLAYSRAQENEADEMGLYFMAMATYNPNAAVGFWQRMKALTGGSSVPVLLSTHPDDDTRISKIKENLPKALSYYKP
jgi:predicted Zn-dependent protease